MTLKDFPTSSYHRLHAWVVAWRTELTRAKCEKIEIAMFAEECEEARKKALQ
jgi:hypothetical protein